MYEIQKYYVYNLFTKSHAWPIDKPERWVYIVIKMN